MATPVDILEVDHVVFRVRDIERSIAFYRDVLGCPVERENEAMGFYHMRVGWALIDLVALDGKIGARDGAGPAEEGRNVDHVCLSIEPFDESALREHLANTVSRRAKAASVTVPMAWDRRSMSGIPTAT